MHTEQGFRAAMEKNMKITNVCFLIIAALLLSGCARLTYTYPSRLDPEVRAAPRTPVLVAVQDQRPYVKNKETQETFAGLIRSGTGVVTHHQSATGRPLASDMASAVANRLQKNGARVSTVHVEPSRTEDEVRGELGRKNPGLVLFIAIRELKADINFASRRTTVSHDLVVTVYGKGNKVIGTTALVGKDAEDADLYHIDREQERIAARINQRIATALNDPAIVKVLK